MIVNMKGKPMVLKDLTVHPTEKCATPHVNAGLLDLIDGAMAISRISLRRIPSPQELIMQGEWLERARNIIVSDRRFYGK